MILSNEDLFSDQQAITATALSENVLDLGVAKDLGKGVPIPILIQVTEDFNTLTNLIITLEVDDSEAIDSATVVQSTTVLLADLVAGKRVPPMFLPEGVSERYCALRYTVTGTPPTTGKITAGFTMGNQTNITG